MTTVVIGAGAAGIGAARALHDAGGEVLLLEANDRLGGRARSVRLDLPHSAPGTAGDTVTVDFGCGWLHSARRNPWTAIAEAEGFHVDRSDPGWGQQWRDLGYSPAEQRATGEAYERLHDAARAARKGPDQLMSNFVAADDPCRPILDAISGYYSGAPLDRVSLHDWSTYEADETNDNWTVKEGYGTLVAHRAGPVPFRLSTPVTRIDHGGRTIRVETAAGTIEAGRVIVAVPTTILARGEIAFHPPLPAKRDAAAGLPLGIADKCFFAVSGTPPWDAPAHLTGNPHSAITASYRLGQFGWPIIEMFYGGLAAEALNAEGAAAAFGIDELVALLGSDFRHRLHPLGASRWLEERWARGSYSYALTGHAGDRALLAETVEDRLFFVGEACSPKDFTTAHGAYETGVAAAEAILRASRSPR
jgi:monoamine oxidase